jgi:hypothetical protein
LPAEAPADAFPAIVTRTEILDALRPAFDGTGADKAALLATAEAASARPQAIAILRRLPDNADVRHARELWALLPDLPVK